MPSSSEYLGLSVDIDSTDFGYGVGEVEAILNNGDDACMADARKRIGQLVAEICAASESAAPNAATSELPTVGKLETYLMEKRPRHYNAIITAGIFKPV
jgi:thiamine-triphosphatase